jgi:hypothetical protein
MKIKVSINRWEKYNKYICNGYAIVWRERTTRVHTHIEVNNFNNKTINSYLFVS